MHGCQHWGGGPPGCSREVTTRQAGREEQTANPGEKVKNKNQDLWRQLEVCLLGFCVLVLQQNCSAGELRKMQAGSHWAAPSSGLSNQIRGSNLTCLLKVPTKTTLLCFYLMFVSTKSINQLPYLQVCYWLGSQEDQPLSSDICANQWSLVITSHYKGCQQPPQHAVVLGVFWHLKRPQQIYVSSPFVMTDSPKETWLVLGTYCPLCTYSQLPLISLTRPTFPN